MTQQDAPARLEALVGRLAAVPATGAPVLTATFDLRPGSDGQPSAARLITEGRREAFDALPDNQRREIQRWMKEQTEALVGVISEGIASGAQGVFYLHTFVDDDDEDVVIETPLPIRNSFQIGQRPWLFELVRYLYLYDRSVTLVTTDMHTMTARRMRSGVEVAEHEEDGSAHFLSGRGQRTSMDRSGGAGVGTGQGNRMSGAPGAAGGSQGQGIAGGHSKSRVERQILESRLNWASQASEELQKFLDDGDLLIVAGIDEARSQFLNNLPEKRRAGVVQMQSLDPLPDERTLAALAADWAAEARRSEAAQAVEDWASGALGDRAVAGYDFLLPWFERGRLGRLVVHEQAVPHLGDAGDSRAHRPEIDPVRVDEAIRQALAVSAEIAVTDDDRLLANDGLLGIARW